MELKRQEVTIRFGLATFEDEDNVMVVKQLHEIFSRSAQRLGTEYNVTVSEIVVDIEDCAK